MKTRAVRRAKFCGYRPQDSKMSSASETQTGFNSIMEQAPVRALASQSSAKARLLGRRSRAAEVLEQELLRQREASIGQDNGFGLACWVRNPPALVQQVHHAPVESFPDAGAIVERHCEKTEGDLGELLRVQPIRDFGVLHGMGPGPHNVPGL